LSASAARRWLSPYSDFRNLRVERPQLQASRCPRHVLQQEFAELAEGVRLELARLSLTFDEARRAVEKLLALAMAIGNDFVVFESASALVGIEQGVIFGPVDLSRRMG